jgi:hypothetical protein
VAPVSAVRPSLSDIEAYCAQALRGTGLQVSLRLVADMDQFEARLSRRIYQATRFDDVAHEAESAVDWVRARASDKVVILTPEQLATLQVALDTVNGMDADLEPIRVALGEAF